MNNLYYGKRTLLLIPLFLVFFMGCQDKEQSTHEPELASPSLAQKQSRPLYVSSAQQSGNSIHYPLATNDTAEPLTGNLLVSVDVENEKGISAVALSFNDSEFLYLCENNQCGENRFHITKSAISLDDFEIYYGPVTIALWVFDSTDHHNIVDQVTVDWQRSKVDGLNITRSNAGDVIDIAWPAEANYFNYNVYLASEPGVNVDNFKTLADGQAFLSIESPSIQVNNLDATKTYYLSIAGVNGGGESAFSTEVIMMPPTGDVNTAPEATNDVIIGDEDTLISGNLLANDTDAQQNTLYLSTIALSYPSQGRLSLSANGDFSYIPPANYHGEVEFSYEIQDGFGGFAQATASVTVKSVNDLPVAINDSYETTRGTKLTVANSDGLLVNDSDIDGDNLQVSLTPTVEPVQGELTLNADGSFDYYAYRDAVGTDSFTYQINDGNGGSTTAKVTLNILASNTVPIAVNDSYTLDQDTKLMITTSESVLANDSDPDGDLFSIAQIVTNVQNGTLSHQADGAFTYTPNVGFFGEDSFSYQIADGFGGLAQATVTLTVKQVIANRPPIAVDDFYTVGQGIALNVTAVLDGLLTNDTDPDDDNLSLSRVISNVEHGNLTFDSDGTFTYIPLAIFTGVDRFTYQISDGRGGFANASVTIHVVNDSDIFSSTPSRAITLSSLFPYQQARVQFNDVAFYPMYGELYPNDDGLLTYSVGEGFAGNDSFVYELSDVNDSSVISKRLAVINVSELFWLNRFTLPHIPLKNYRSISYDGVDYFIAGDNQIISSKDGVNWLPSHQDNRLQIKSIATREVSEPSALISNVALTQDYSYLIQKSHVEHATFGQQFWSEIMAYDLYSMERVVSVDDQFVMLGLDSARASEDGLVWQDLMSPITGGSYLDMISFNNAWIAVGENGIILRYQYEQWTPIIHSLGKEHLVKLATNGTRLVAVGSSGQIISSLDGTSWEKSTSNTTNSLNSVTYGNGKFIAVGVNSTAVASNDGVNWTPLPVDVVDLHDVIFDGKRFIATGDRGTILTSTDGQNFQPVVSDNYAKFTSVAFKDGIIYRAGTNTGILATGDFSIWYPTSAASSTDINKMVTLGGRIFAVGNAGLLMTSDDGVNWSTQSPVTSKDIYDITLYQQKNSTTGEVITSLYIAVGSDGLLMTSLDGSNWGIEGVTDLPAISDNLYAVTVDQASVIAVGDNGRILVRDFRSAVGDATWLNTHTNVSYGQLNDIVFDGKTNIIVGDAGVIIKGSPQLDGFVLDSSTTFTITENLNAIAWKEVSGFPSYVMVGDNGVTYSSDDAISWRVNILGTSEHLNEVILPDELDAVIAVGDNGAFIVGVLNEGLVP